MNASARQISAACLAVSCCLAAAATTRGALQTILPVTAYAQNSYANRGPVYAINGAGLGSDGTHGTSPDNTMWMGSSSSAFATWYVVDLGDVHALHSLKFWNYNHAGYTTRGVKTVDIYVSTAAAPTRPPNYADTATWTLAKANHTVAQATGTTDYAGDAPVDMSFVNARWVGLDILEIHNAGSGYGGLAEIQFYSSSSPAVRLESVTNVTATSIDVTGSLLRDNGLPTHVLVCAGETDGGTASPAAWDVVADWGVKAEGTFRGTLSGLAADRGYYVTLCATNGVDEPGWWGDVATFITGVVSVEGPGDIYRSVHVPRAITFRRPASTAGVLLTVHYTLGGTAIAGEDYEPLPGTFEFPVGQSAYEVPFTVLNDGPPEGDRTVIIGTAPGTYLTNASSTASFVLLDDSDAKVVAWTGGGSDTAWNDAANWDLGVPGVIDTAVFDGTGTLPNVVALDADQHIRKLVIATTTAFTIGAAGDVTAGYSLTLTEVERQDVDGTEGRHAFEAPVRLAPDDSGNSTWTVNGSSELRLNASLDGAVSGVELVKTGTATLALNGNTTYTGTTTVLEGAVNRPNFDSFGNNLQGDLVVGAPGGTVPASYTAHNGGRPRNATVHQNGTYYQGDWPALGFLTIIGGTVNSSWPNINGDIKMTGGVLNGGPVERGGTGHYTYASPTTAMITGEFRLYQYAYNDSFFDVQDGEAPIDLWVSGTVKNASTSRSVIKRGAGAMRLTGNNSSFNERNVYVNAGTLLVDNTSGSGTGKAAVQVNAGATLGGTGFIGGVAGYTAANVTVSSTSSSSPAVLAPGTLDDVTGDHVIGTLTVGGAAQTNNVVFGNNSRMRATIGANGTADRLTVHGALDLSSTSDGIVLSVDPDAKPGTYVLAGATGGIAGTFDTVTGLPVGRSLDYTATTIELTIPPKGAAIIVR